MATNMTGMRVEETTVNGSVGKREHGHKSHNVAYSLTAAIFALALIGGVAVHNRRVSHPAAPAVARPITAAETRFLEENTITLPDGTAMNTRPVDMVEQQKFLEVNTTMPDPGAVAEVGASPVTTTAVVTSGQQRFLEANTTLLPQTLQEPPYMEALTPPPGQAR